MAEENMERLTTTSDKGGVAFTFNLDITCDKSEIMKILKLAEKLKEYEDLEEQGKLLKLPCAVGDTMYTNLSMQGWRFKKKDRPYKVKVVFVGINGVDNCMHVAFDNGCMFQFWFSDIGKTIFLTKESAEAALKN